MEGVTIRENYDDYDSVKESFKDFLSTLVWNCIDIDESCVSSNDINSFVSNYCRAKAGDWISLINDGIGTYIRNIEPRYKVSCWEVDINGETVVGSVVTYKTSNEVTALKKAAEFYRKAYRPCVEVFDNKERRYIAKWN